MVAPRNKIDLLTHSRNTLISERQTEGIITGAEGRAQSGVLRVHLHKPVNDRLELLPREVRGRNIPDEHVLDEVIRILDSLRDEKRAYPI